MGLPYQFLIDEAHATKLLIRLRETKGQVPFHQELISFYATPDFGGLGVDLADSTAATTSTATDKNPVAIYDKTPPPRPVGANGAMAGTDQQPTGSCFTSAHKQLLVLSRMRRVAKLDLHRRSGLPAKEKLAAFLHDRLQNRKRIRAAKIQDFLTAFGGMRVGLELCPVMGQPVKLLALQVQAYPVKGPQTRHTRDCLCVCAPILSSVEH